MKNITTAVSVGGLLFSFKRIQVPANGEIELGFLAGIFVVQLPSETHNLSMALLQNNNAGNVLVQYSRISYFNEGEYITIYKKEEGGSWFAKNSTGGIIAVNYSAIVLYQG